MSDIEISIRPAEPRDVDRLVEFNLNLVAETEPHDFDAAVMHRGVTTVVGDANKGRYFVAEAAGEVVGCLMITLEWSDWRNGDLWWIQSVYVDAEHRGRGVFRALHRVAREAARDTGAVGLRLYVERDNGAAISTYGRLGMTDAGYFLMEEIFDEDAPPTS